MVRRLRSLLVAVLLATLPACSAWNTRQVPEEEVLLPALSLSRAELMDRLETLSSSIETLRASVTYEARVVLPDGEERTSQPINGGLVATRPALLRMQGQVPLVAVTAFDMSADAREFRLSIPPRDEFFTGSNEVRVKHENPMVNLRPQDILRSLFVDIRPYLESDRFATVVNQVREGIRSYYVVEFIDLSAGAENAVVAERLFVDRFDLEIARKRLFNRDGALEMNVEYTGHQEVDGIPFPGEIFMERPLEQYSLRIQFHDTQINVALQENVFDLDPPEGIPVTVLVDGEDLTANPE